MKNKVKNLIIGGVLIGGAGFALTSYNFVNNEIENISYSESKIKSDDNNHFKDYYLTSGVAYVIIEDNKGFDHLFSWGAQGYSGQSIESIYEEELEVPSFDNTSYITNFDEIVFPGHYEYNLTFSETYIWNENDMAILLEENDNQYLYEWGFNDYRSDENTGKSYVDRPILIASNDNKYSLDSWLTYLDDKIVDFGINYIVTKNNSGNESLYMWGDNHYGQVGINDSSNHTIYEPEKVNFDVSNYTFKDISMSEYTSSAVIVDNSGNESLYMWGDNHYGQVGINDSSNYKIYEPKKVNFDESNYTFKDISMSRYTSSAVIADNSGNESLYMWGDNSYGQVGINDSSNYKIYEPKKVNFDVSNYEILKYQNYSTNQDDPITSLIRDKDTNNWYLYAWGNNDSGIITQTDLNLDGSLNDNEESVTEKEKFYKPQLIYSSDETLNNTTETTIKKEQVSITSSNILESNDLLYYEYGIEGKNGHYIDFALDTNYFTSFLHINPNELSVTLNDGTKDVIFESDDIIALDDEVQDKDTTSNEKYENRIYRVNGLEGSKTYSLESVTYTPQLNKETSYTWNYSTGENNTIDTIYDLPTDDDLIVENDFETYNNQEDENDNYYNEDLVDYMTVSIKISSSYEYLNLEDLSFSFTYIDGNGNEVTEEISDNDYELISQSDNELVFKFDVKQFWDVELNTININYHDDLRETMNEDQADFSYTLNLSTTKPKSQVISPKSSSSSLIWLWILIGILFIVAIVLGVVGSIMSKNKNK